MTVNPSRSMSNVIKTTMFILADDSFWRSSATLTRLRSSDPNSLILSKIWKKTMAVKCVPFIGQNLQTHLENNEIQLAYQTASPSMLQQADWQTWLRIYLLISTTLRSTVIVTIHNHHCTKVLCGVWNRALASRPLANPKSKVSKLEWLHQTNSQKRRIWWWKIETAAHLVVFWYTTGAIIPS